MVSCALGSSESMAVALHSMCTSSRSASVAWQWCVSSCLRWSASLPLTGAMSTSLSEGICGAHLVCLGLDGGQYTGPLPCGVGQGCPRACVPFVLGIPLPFTKFLEGMVLEY